MKGKKKTAFILAMLLSLSVSAAFSKNNKFSVDYVFEPTQTDECPGCGYWTIKDTQILSEPGAPLVPYRAAKILLPQGAVVKDVKVKHGKPFVQKGFDLPWGQPPCTFSDTPVKVERNEKIYGSDNDYPGKFFDFVSVESFRGFQILLVNLYPVQYMPKSQTVKFYETMTVEVQFSKGVKNKLYRGLPGDKQDAANLVDNPDMLSTYESEPTPLATEEYIIITNDTMASTFQTLANWKADFVEGASVYTVSWITANYSGTDNQDKIRNFIIDKYDNNGTLYVLMGGDTSAVPYRGFYVSTGGYTDSDMAADMYFAHLDGSHNADGDSRYGETNDNVDFYAEVAVGRAPCQSVTEAENFVDKVIAYEQADKPERVCFHQSRVQSNNNPDSRCLAYNCDNYIPGSYTIDYLFEENGNVSKTDWRNAWAAGPIVVVHIGHGNTNVYYINYEVGGTVAWYNSDCSSLTNTFFPWTTSVACICGEFEANDCLAEAYVMDDCGAIAAIYNDNYGWFMSTDACALSGEFCEMEVRACWDDGYEKLGDILNRSRYYLASSAQSDSYYRWCFYERNLVGDPESPCLTTRGVDSVTITNPSDGETVSETVNITTFTTGCIDTVEFYIDGSLKYTDTTSPFAWDWDTTLYDNGNYTILVKGYCSGVFQDSDTITVTVDNDYVKIANPPQPGETVSCTVNIEVETGGVDTVKFYIDDVLVHTDTTLPFQFAWDTCLYLDGSYTVTVKGYNSGVFIDSDTVVYQVYHYYVKITSPQQGEEVSGIVTITVDANCVDTAELYIDDVLMYTESIDPPHEGEIFQYEWNTFPYSQGPHTIKVKGYEAEVFKGFDEIIVYVGNVHIEITNPQDGEPVSCTVLVTTYTSEAVKAVKFYIDGDERHTDGEAPFEFSWNTCLDSDGEHIIKAEAYGEQPLTGSGEILLVPIGFDEITVYVSNPCIEITNPQEGDFVYGTVHITTSESCCVNSVDLYIYKVGEPAGDPIDTGFGSSYEYYWDTTLYEEDEQYIICIKAYLNGELMCTDQVTVTVDNIYVRITNPQDGEEVYGTVHITVDTRGIEMVQFYIDDICMHTDCESPFEYLWDTTSFEEDKEYTITVKGCDAVVPEICSGQLKNPFLQCETQDQVTVTVNNFYVKITNPQDGDQVSGMVLITTDTRGIDTVRFYIDDISNPYECEDTSAPFECNWDTTNYENGDHNVIARGYASGDFQDQDTVTCTVCNGSAALCLGILLGCARILIRKY